MLQQLQCNYRFQTCVYLLDLPNTFKRILSVGTDLGSQKFTNKSSDQADMLYCHGLCKQTGFIVIGCHRIM